MIWCYWDKKMKTETKTAIILGAIILGAIIGISAALSTLETQDTKNQSSNSETRILGNLDKSNFKKAPKLVGITEYINTSAETLEEEIKDKVVMYDIWTYSCINCIRTLPYITAWNEKYSNDGLLIIGIHSPEFEFEKDPYNVQMAVNKHGISYPVVLDNNMETWKAFENRYWPRKYLADHEGYIRYNHIGEGGYQETEMIIQQLLKERANALGLNVASAQQLVDIEEFEHSNFRTPELYFGYNFIQGRDQLGNEEGFRPGKDVLYKFPQSLRQHYFYLEGVWKNLADNMELVSDSGKIKIQYHAKEVNIVASNNATLEIFLDGKPIPEEYSGTDVIEGKITVSESRIYNIISSAKPDSHLLEIVVDNPGFEIYTFTFG